MPIIPLLNSKALPDLPNAVPTTAKFPTVNPAGLMNAVDQLGSVKMPELPADKLTAPYRALGAVGEAIQQAGGVMEALGAKRKQAQTDYQVAQVDSAMDTEVAKFDQWKMETKADPATHEAEWQKRLSAFQEQINNRTDLTQETRDALKPRMVRFEGQSSARVMEGAAKDTFALAKSEFAARLDRAIEGQDEGGFTESLKTAESRGYLYPHEVENYRQQFKATGDRKTKEAKAEKDRTDFQLAVAPAIVDPAKWLKENVAPPKDATPEQLIQWKKVDEVARDQFHKGASDATDKVVNAIAGGEITVPSQIDAYDSRLTPKMKEEAKHYLATRDAAAEAQDREKNGAANFADLYTKVSTFDRSSFKTDEEAQVAAFNLRKELIQRVGKQDDGFLAQMLWRKANSKLEQGAETKDLVNQNIRSYFDPSKGVSPWLVPETKTVTHFFGKDTQAMVDKNGRVVSDAKDAHLVLDPAKQRAAQVAIAYTKQRMTDWAQAHPQDINDPAKVSEALSKAVPEGLAGKAFMRMQQKQDAAKPAVAPAVKPTSVPAKSAMDDPFGAELKKVEATRKSGAISPQTKEILSRDAEGGAARSDAITGMHPDFAQRLARMINDAPGGIHLYSGYRSTERQKELWADALKKYGSPEAARKWVAPPGNSQHNHGRAADLKFDDGMQDWAHKNAAKYGLHFRMGREPWHIEPL